GKAPRQLPAQHGGQGGGGRVFLAQRDQDLAVHGTDCRRIAQGNVDAAVGQPDVVEDDADLPRADELADGGLDFGESGVGGLDACAWGRAYVQPHLAGVDLGEEV